MNTSAGKNVLGQLPSVFEATMDNLDKQIETLGCAISGLNTKLMPISYPASIAQCENTSPPYSEIEYVAKLQMFERRVAELVEVVEDMSSRLGV